MKNTFKLSTALSLIALSAQADPIIRDFHSVRAAGMGDVRYTTGVFEENFFANPARLPRNPEDLLQLPQISVEAGSATVNALSSLTKNSSGDGLSKYSDAVGKPVSASFQIVIPAYYNRSVLGGNWAFAVGVEVRAQTAAQVGQTALINPYTILNAGPEVTLARKFF